jgi:hypothetical protein
VQGDAAPAVIDRCAIHLPPQAFYVQRVLADQYRAKAAGDEVRRGCFDDRFDVDQLQKLERYFDSFLPVIGARRDLGLTERMAFGSDAGPFDTEFGHLDYNVHLARRAGLTPMESLQAVTRNAARLCGLIDQVGTLEAGKQADLLLLDADPLANEQNLTRVAAVFMSGVPLAV